MSDLPGLLWGTVVLRPYVFTFLAVYLVAGCFHVGWKRTLAYIPLGYCLAWISEYSSIHWGFPYGDYFYIDTTSDRELWVLGVPFMDSLSYVFLSYCSYSLAVFLMSPAALEPGRLLVMETPSIRRSPCVLLLGAFLFVMLDVIIDPVALQGHRWFLGQIYGYKTQGYYFGIPMSNFGGWLLVGLVLMAAQQLLDAWSRLDVQAAHSGGPATWIRLLGPILYFSVLGFDIFMTFYIGEILLGIVGLLITASLLVPMFFFTLFKVSHAPHPALPGHIAKSARGHSK